MMNNPRTIQRSILWASLLAIAALAILSIVGASLGPDPAVEAQKLFNSPPLVVYWFLLAGVLLSGFFTFKRLAHSPGPLAAHLGALLILIGAMWGSQRGHDVAHKFLGSHKIRSGAMIVPRGESTNRIVDKVTEAESNMPFQVKLEDFWIEYYPLKKTDWGLLVETAPPPGAKAEPRQAAIEWTAGKEMPIPFTKVRLKVLQHFPHAQPVFEANVPHALEIVRADGNSLLLPVVVGMEASLPEANVAVRIVRVFSHLMVVGKGEVVDMLELDSPGPPAVELRIDQPGDPNRRAFVTEGGMIGHGPTGDSLKMRYKLPPVMGARKANQGPPAMEVLLIAGEKQVRHWFMPAPGQEFDAFSVGELTGVHPASAPEPAAPHGAHGGHGGHEETYLVFVQPTVMPKAYKSQVVILENGRQQAAQIIEVNNPLHYGGYHFYQQDYDHEGEQYTVLGVTSDSGLYTVYAGFALMLLGVGWVLWSRLSQEGPIASDQSLYRLVCLGFPLLTLGLVLGAVWGKLAWGDYWAWDPKELWSLVSWLVLLGYLHWRSMHAQRFPRANSALVTAGLLAIVATLFLVNTGVHSYSGSGRVLHLKATLLGGLVMGAMGAYAVAAVALALKVRKYGQAFLAIGFALALAAVVKRWIDVDHLPLQNLFEVFLFLGMLAFPISLFSRVYLRVGGQAVDAALGFVVLFPAAFVFTAEPQQLPPALQSWLFAPHVGAYMLAYVILAKAGLLALGRLFGIPAGLPVLPEPNGGQAPPPREAAGH